MQIKTLKAKLNLAFLIVFLCPLLAATIFCLVYYSKQIEREALGKIGSEINSFTQALGYEAEDQRELVHSFGTLMPWAALVELNLPEKLSEKLATEALSRGLDEIVVVGRDQRVIASSDHSEGRAVLPADSRFCDCALAGQATCDLELIESSSGGHVARRLSLTATAPLLSLSHKSPIGLVIVRRFFRDDGYLARKLYPMLSLNAFIYAGNRLVSMNGRKWTDTDSFETLKPHIAQLVYETGESYQEVSITRGGYLARYVPLSGADGTVQGILMVGIPADKYVNTRNQAIGTILAIAGAALLLTLLIRLLIGRSILIPLGRLKEGTQIVASGDYSHQLQTNSSDEIAELTHSFNRMSLALLSSRRRLEEYSESLERYRDHLEDKVAFRTRELEYRIELESFITGLSTRFIHLPSDRIDAEIHRAMALLGQFCKVDRSYVCQLLEDGLTYVKVSEWRAPGIPSGIGLLEPVRLEAEAPLFASRLQRRESLTIYRLSDLPEEADKEKRFMRNNGMKSATIVPMVCGDSILGYIGFTAVRSERAWDETTVSLLRIVGEIFANAMRAKQADETLRKAHSELERKVEERTRELSTANSLLKKEIEEKEHIEKALRTSERQLRLLSSRLFAIQEEERKRIAREVHDSIGSTLTGIKIHLENAAGAVEDGSISAETIHSLVSVVQDAMGECRRIMMDLRPSILDHYGITATIYWLCEQFQSVHPSVFVEKEVALTEEEIPDELKTTLFRILQETFNNIAKHSEADTIRLSLVESEDGIRLTVEDNGAGFDQRSTPYANGLENGFGLTSIKERAELTGGNLSVQSAPGAGTVVRAFWPKRIARV